MIKVNKNGNVIKITGHSGYDTVNGLLNINEKSIEFLDNDEYMEIKVLLSDDITNSLILNMMTMLKELEKSYPKNIKVNEE